MSNTQKGAAFEAMAVMCIVAVLQGCSGFGKTMSVDQSAVPAVSTQAVSREPLVIEILDGGLPAYYLIKKAGMINVALNALRETWGDVRANGHQIMFDKSDTRAGLGAAERTLMLVEIKNALRKSFPNASVYMNGYTLDQQIAAGRSLKSLESFGANAWSIPHAQKVMWMKSYMLNDSVVHQPQPIADIVLRVSHFQIVDPDEISNNLLNGSFGRGFSLDVVAWVPSSGASLVRWPQNGEPLNSAEMKECSEAFNAAAADSSSEDAKNLSKGGSHQLQFCKAFAEKWYLDYEPARFERIQSRIGAVAYKSHSATCKVTGLISHQASDEALRNWRGYETSPMRPVYESLANALAGEVAKLDVGSLRVQTARNWASFYEARPDVVALFATSPMRTPTGDAGLDLRINMLHTLKEAELTYLSKYDAVTREFFYGSAEADKIRAARIEQASQASSYKFKMIAGSLLHIVTLGASGVASSRGQTQLASSQLLAGASSNKQLWQTLETAAAVSREHASAIAAAVGPILLEIGGISTPVTAEGYTEFRDKLRSIYLTLDLSNSP